MQDEQTTIIGTGAERRRRTVSWGASLAVAAIVAAALIGGVALHGRGVSEPIIPAIPQAKSQAQTKLLENNTTNLPNAIAQGDLPISGSQRRLLEVNTTMLAQDDPVYPYAEAVTPHIGRPR
jgi:hypothetical protein